MTTYTYPLRELLPDYARAGGGFVITALALPWLVESTVPFTIFALLALAFAAYGASTYARQRTRVVLDDDGVRSESFRTIALPWTELTDMELRYYSVRRDRQRGWMQLRLTGRGRKRIVIDSALDGFVDLTRSAMGAAMQNGVGLNEATAANLRGLGLHPADAPARQDAAG